MHFRNNVSLKACNTFGIDVFAENFASFSNIGELEELLDVSEPKNRIILGGGSNILFTKNVKGYVLKNELKGIELVHEDDNHIYVKVCAGENWHKLVMYCIESGYCGLENMSLIPGNVGASPMQNIGAYGVEVKDVFYSLEAYHIDERKISTFSLNDCEFGYRESVFKTKLKGQFIILSVTFRLNKRPSFHTSYGAITQELESMGVKNLTIKAISDAVIRIRLSKLPNPAETGNAGSFFKNPAIDAGKLSQLQSTYPTIPHYPLTIDGNQAFKIAAGWLIEQCGWKGFRKGDAGCHSKQALVLVNFGMATGLEIYDLSCQIIASVQKRFDITLEREVNIY